MKLKCIKSVLLYDEEGIELYQSFTQDKEYNARRGTVKGLNNDPYSVIEVLRAKNDNGDSHIIKHINDGESNEFFNTHFEIIK